MNKPKTIPVPQSLFGDLELELPELTLAAQIAADAAQAQTCTERVSVLRANEPKPKKRQPTKTQANKTQPVPSAAALAGQAFLPGLSRRGRPRLKTPISAVERTAAHRRKRLEAGSKRVEIILDRDVSSALDALAEHFKEPRNEVISTLILKTASRVLKR